MIKHSLNIIFLIIIFVLMGFIFITSTRVNMAKQHLQKTKHQLAREQENNQVLTAEWAYLTSPDILAKAKINDGAMLESINFWQVKNIDGLKSSNSAFANFSPPAEIYKIHEKPKITATTSVYKKGLKNKDKANRAEFKDNSQEYTPKTNEANILLSKF